MFDEDGFFRFVLFLLPVLLLFVLEDFVLVEVFFFDGLVVVVSRSDGNPITSTRLKPIITASFAEKAVMVNFIYNVPISEFLVASDACHT